MRNRDAFDICGGCVHVMITRNEAWATRGAAAVPSEGAGEVERRLASATATGVRRSGKRAVGPHPLVVHGIVEE